MIVALANDLKAHVGDLFQDHRHCFDDMVNGLIPFQSTERRDGWNRRLCPDGHREAGGIDSIVNHMKVVSEEANIDTFLTCALRDNGNGCTTIHTRNATLECLHVGSHDSSSLEHDAFTEEVVNDPNDRSMHEQRRHDRQLVDIVNDNIESKVTSVTPPPQRYRIVVGRSRSDPMHV